MPTRSRCRPATATQDKISPTRVRRRSLDHS
jgi:hypothetical protein